MQKQKLFKYWKKLWLSSQEIESVILHYTGLTNSHFFLVDTVDNYQEILGVFEKISTWKPIEYVIWVSEFIGRKYFVDESTLIPRQDTELIVQAVLDQKYDNQTQYIEIGTWSWIIAISLALELKNTSSIQAYDVSKKALQVAQKNAREHRVENKIQFWISDLLDWVDLSYRSKIQKIIIIANLPYIKNKDYWNMSASTVTYEPSLALYGGEKTGFELYEKFVHQILKKKLLQDVELFIEIGFDQAEIARQFFTDLWLNFEFYKDSATIDRVVHIYF